MNSRRAVAQLLNYLSGIGVTHLPKVLLPEPKLVPQRLQRISSSERMRGSVTSGSAVSGSAGEGLGAASETSGRRAEQQAAETVADRKPAYSAFNTPAALRNGSVVVPETHQLTRSLTEHPPDTPQEKATALQQLQAVVAECTRCEALACSRRQTVFGVGDPNARIMFIGEAPGADEDVKGEPFVGKAGQLLNRIIESSRLKREDLYICNILRCRPPGNRNPLPQEAANCREYLDAQIRIVRPAYIICWGTIAAQNLLNETRAVGRLRGQFFDYHGAKVMCTYHPSYLLRYPSAKAQVWEDMKFFMKELGVILN